MHLKLLRTKKDVLNKTCFIFLLILLSFFYSNYSIAQFSGTYWIKNAETGDNLRVSDLNVYSDIQTAPPSNDGSWTRWEFIQNGSYYHIKSSRTGNYIRPRDGDLNSTIYTVPNTWTGNWTQWTIQNLGSGQYRFVNRQTGDYMRPRSGDFAEIIQVPTSYSGTWPRWQLVPITGTNPTPTPTNCDVPHDVLPMDFWKITIPFTSAQGGSDGNTNDAAEVDWSDGIDEYERSPYFTNSGCNYVQFRAHVGGATTNGSGYPRSELREMNYRGNEASWSSTSGTHTMEVDLRVTALPPVKSHITILQIHDGDDDVITFRLENSTLFLEIDGDDGPVATSNYSLGQRVTLKFEVSGGQTRAYYNGNLFHTHNQSYSGAYFKTGAYTQSACGGNNEVDGESCSSYGEVEIFDINLNHD